MLVIEKILLLKSVTLFQQVPDDLLMQIVLHSITEKFVEADQNILKKGDKGRYMYIIATGRAKIHDGDRIIKELSEREIFGELAALSFGKRVSSVTAITDCLLLKISSPALYELMDLDVGLAKGIIKSLCNRAESIAEQLQAEMRERKS